MRDILYVLNQKYLGDFSLSCESSGMLATWVADYTPDQDFSGSDEIKFEVTSSMGTSTLEGVISISITPVNDLPVIENIASVSLDEDSDAYTFTVSYSDIDDDLSATISSESSDIAASVNSGDVSAEVTITPAGDYYGTSSVTFTVTESDGEATTSSTFIVNIF